jgi:hypothetical protein
VVVFYHYVRPDDIATIPLLNYKELTYNS